MKFVFSLLLLFIVAAGTENDSAQTAAATPVTDNETVFKSHAKEYYRLKPLLDAASEKADLIESRTTAENKQNNRNAYFRAPGENSVCTALAEYEAVYDKAFAESTAMSDMIEAGDIKDNYLLENDADEAAYALDELGGDILTRQLIWRCTGEKPETAVVTPVATDLRSRTKAAIEKKDLDTILAEINGIIAKDKKNAEAFSLRGDIYLAEGKAELARADHNQAVKLSPKNSIFYSSRAMSFLANPDYDQQAAFADLNKAIELDNTNLEAHRQRAAIFASQIKYSEAKNDYLEILKTNPLDANANYNVGHYFVKENNADEAINYFTRSIKADPKFPYVYVERGQVYEFLKRYDEAAKDYSMVIQILPDQGIGYANRADVYARLKLYALAVKDYSKIISMSGRSTSDHMRRGDIYSAWGKYDEALADYEAAMKLSPSDPAPPKRYNDLVPIVNAARATAQELSSAFNSALDVYDPLEVELAAKMDIYLALKKSKEATPTTGQSPVCDQIPPLTDLTTRTIAALAPIVKLYDQGKLKGFSQQIDFAGDRSRRIDNTLKMLERDRIAFSCK